MTYRRLFLDLEEVTRLERVHRQVHPAVRHPANPVLACEHPWEDRVSLRTTATRKARSSTACRLDGLARIIHP